MYERNFNIIVLEFRKQGDRPYIRNKEIVFI